MYLVTRCLVVIALVMVLMALHNERIPSASAADTCPGRCPWGSPAPSGEPTPRPVPTPQVGTIHSNRPTPAPTGEIGTAIQTTRPTAPPTDVQ